MRKDCETKPLPPAGGVPWYVEALLLVAMGVLVLQTLLFAYPARGHLPGCDSGIFLYAGSRVLQGELPYKDVWDHKPPGIFYVDALGLLIGRGSGWGIWALQLLAVAGSAALSYTLLRRLLGPLAAGLASMAWAARLFLFVGNGNLIEEYALPLQWLALWLFFRAERRCRYTWEGYAIGAAGALAFLLRQNLISMWLAIGLYQVLRAAWRREWRALRPMGPMVLAGSGLLLAVLAYFAARGALAELWQVAFGYNLAYARGRPGDLSVSTAVGLRLMPGLVAPALAGWLLGLRQSLRGWPAGDVRARVLSACVLGFPLEVVLSGLSGNAYPHYYVAWLPYCAVLAGGVFMTLERDLRACWAGGLARKEAGLARRRLVCTAAAAVVVPLALAVQITFLPFDNPWARAGQAPQLEVVRYVQETTAPDDTVLMWGIEATTNFLAGRRSPTRFVFQNPLFGVTDYQAGGLARQFLADIEAAKPALIIDSSPDNPQVPPLDPVARQQRLQEPHHFTLQPEMDEVFRYIAAHYRPERTFAGSGWVAYRYVGDR